MSGRFISPKRGDTASALAATTPPTVKKGSSGRVAKFDEDTVDDLPPRSGFDRMKKRRSSIAVELQNIRTEFWTTQPMTVATLEEPDIGFGNMRAGVGLILVDGLSDKRIAVLTVVTDSPAEKEGTIQVGDKIVSINGRNMQYAPLLDVKAAILGVAGTQCTITVDRGAQRVEATLTRQNAAALEGRIRFLEERLVKTGNELQLQHRLKQEGTLRRLEHVVSHWRGRDIGRSFRKWFTATVVCNRNKKLLSKIVKRIQNRSLSLMFDVFVAHWRRMKKFKLIGNAVLRWSKGSMLKAFDAWRLKSVGRSRRLAVVGRVVSRIQRLAVSRGFDTWRLSVRKQNKREKILLSCIKRMRNVLLSRAFSSFITCVKISNRQKIAALEDHLSDEKTKVAQLEQNLANQITKQKRIIKESEERYISLQKTQDETLSMYDHAKLDNANLERIISQLKDEIVSLAAELKGANLERDGLRMELERTLGMFAKLQAEIRQMERMHLERNKEMEEDHRLALARTHQKYHDELADLERSLRAERDRQLLELSDKHNASTRSLAAAHANDISSLKSENARAREILVHEHSADIERVQRQARDMLEQVVLQHGKDLKHHESLTASEKFRRESAEATISKLEASIRKLETQLRELENSISGRVDALVAKEHTRLQQKFSDEMKLFVAETEARYSVLQREWEIQSTKTFNENIAAHERKMREEVATRDEYWSRVVHELGLRHKEELEKKDLEHGLHLDRVREFSYVNSKKLETEISFQKEDLKRTQVEYESLAQTTSSLRGQLNKIVSTRKTEESILSATIADELSFASPSSRRLSSSMSLSRTTSPSLSSHNIPTPPFPSRLSGDFMSQSSSNIYAHMSHPAPSPKSSKGIASTSSMMCL